MKNKIPTAISDLFFNYEKDEAAIYDGETFLGYDHNGLCRIAEEFLASLGDLGVETPSIEALIADFKRRI